MISRVDDLDEAWINFMNDGTLDLTSNNSNDNKLKIKKYKDDKINKNYDSDTSDKNEIDNNKLHKTQVPKTTDIYISTKTKISYLNKPINLKDVFWNIPVINYGELCEGVVKKQMKFNNTSKSDVDEINKKIKEYEYIDNSIIQQIDNPNGRVKFKDIRKISIGICKKDMISYRTKKKSAFYNCFVLILRINVHKNINKGNNSNKCVLFKEFHVKIFNTGKLEIPGIKTDEELMMVLNLLVEILNKYNDIDIDYDNSKSETVLINSNFNSNFYINREKLFNIMKYKYKIQAVFDPCSYPGIQSKLFFDDNGVYSESTTEDNFKRKNISFMIFRTGSILIVGKCEEINLYKVYDYLKELLHNEYNEIKDINNYCNKKKEEKTKKIKKKLIYVDNN